MMCCPVFVQSSGEYFWTSAHEPNPESGFTSPSFVLVLEEAHNYLRPPRQDELWGIRLARDAFERISKEGRKFGLSLIIASQRPSHVSATVLSQCANFLIHRIQNPEDIDYFKRILPLGSRDLLEQLPILAPGEGLLMGSAVNVPTRLNVRKPDPAPQSETSRPWESWQEAGPKFDRADALARWVAEAAPQPQIEEPAAAVEDAHPQEPYVPTDDDVPLTRDAPARTVVRLASRNRFSASPGRGEKAADAQLGDPRFAD